MKVNELSDTRLMQLRLLLVHYLHRLSNVDLQNLGWSIVEEIAKRYPKASEKDKRMWDEAYRKAAERFYPDLIEPFRSQLAESLSHPLIGLGMRLYEKNEKYTAGPKAKAKRQQRRLKFVRQYVAAGINSPKKIFEALRKEDPELVKSGKQEIKLKTIKNMLSKL